MKRMPILFSGELFADYHQIVLSDAGEPPWPDDYSEEILWRRVMIAPGVLIIHTARNMMVPVRAELHAARPPVDVEAFDHVAETAIDCPSGKLILAGLTHFAIDKPLHVPDGRLGVLITFANLGKLSFDGLEGEDSYVIHLWPDLNAALALKVLKQYDDWQGRPKE